LTGDHELQSEREETKMNAQVIGRKNRTARIVLAMLLTVCLVSTSFGAMPLEAYADSSGDGYIFDTDTGTLTVTSNAGTTAWRTDAAINTNATVRYQSIKSVVLESGVTQSGISAFEGCANLTSVTFPASGFTAVGNRSFYGCTGLISISPPDEVASIGNDGFNGCTGLTLTGTGLPSGLTSIGQYAFRYCAALGDMTVPASVTSIGNSAFDSAFNASTNITLTFAEGATAVYAYYFCY
jgi:hypothetical protein